MEFHSLLPFESEPVWRLSLTEAEHVRAIESRLLQGENLGGVILPH